MGENRGHAEFDVREVIAKAEADVDGPSARARRVLLLLAEAGISNWDAYCFAVEFVASVSLALEHTQPEAKSLIRMLYLTHYVRSEDIKWLAETSVSESITTNGQSSPSSDTSKE